MESECVACGYDSSLPVLLVAELSLPISFPSGNQIGSNGRGSAGWAYRKYRQEFAAALHNATTTTPVPKATGRRRVWLRRVYRLGKRPYDRTNLIRGEKPIVDVLVAQGLLVDDSPKWFEGIYNQCPGPADLIELRFEDFL